MADFDYIDRLVEKMYYLIEVIEDLGFHLEQEKDETAELYRYAGMDKDSAYAGFIDLRCSILRRVQILPVY